MAEYMDVMEKLVEMIESARYWGSNTSEEIVENLIANGVTVQEWISVAKRLPDIGVEVLVYSENFGMHVDYYDGDEFGYFHVTHWMPLPQPPKGE